MSLIQEALRRQQEEEAATRPPSVHTEETSDTAAPPPPPDPPPLKTPPTPPASAPPPQPVQPPPPAPPPAPEEPPPPSLKQDLTTVNNVIEPGDPKRRSPFITLFAILFVIVILVGGAVWMIMFAVQQWRQSTQPETAVAVTAEDMPAPAVAEEPVTPPPPQSVPPKTPPTIAKPAVPTEPPVAPAIARDEPVSPPQPDVVAQEPSESSSTPVPQAMSPREARTTAAKAPVDWPTLMLQGVLGRGQNGSAIINQQVLAVNEMIEGARVIAVGRQSVQLEYEGETRTIKVGMSTP